MTTLFHDTYKYLVLPFKKANQSMFPYSKDVLKHEMWNFIERAYKNIEQ